MNRETRSRLVCLLAGALFGAAWWVLIDAASHVNEFNDSKHIEFTYTLPGIAASLALVLLNMITWDDVSGFDESNERVAKCMLFTASFFLIGSVVGGVVILIIVYGKDGEKSYPGVAIMMQNLLICVSAIVFRIGRNLAD